MKPITDMLYRRRPYAILQDVVRGMQVEAFLNFRVWRKVDMSEADPDEQGVEEKCQFA